MFGAGSGSTCAFHVEFLNKINTFIEIDQVLPVYFKNFPMRSSLPNSRLMEQELLEKCISFLNSIGIGVVLDKINRKAFLPGLSIENGCIIIDSESLQYPGDILHEAGHIAVVPALERVKLDATEIEKRENREAEEMMAIAWSYAACIYLEIDPCFVFHDKGYKGGGSYIAENFREKRYFGLPMLQWIGLTADENNAADLNIKPFPHMIKWLRD